MILSKYKNYIMEAKTSKEAQLIVDTILDKISKIGYENLSARERDILTRFSEGGEDAIKEYLPKGVNITFDNKGMLFDGLPYEEYQRRENEKEKETDSSGYKSIKGEDSGKEKYRVRVYRKFGSAQRHFYIFEENGEKKVYRIIDDKTQYGSGINKLKNWDTYNIEKAHNKLVDNHGFDQFRDLSSSEASNFESFLILRKRFLRGELEKNKEQLKELDNLYNYFKSA